jgi:hypothetical protein
MNIWAFALNFSDKNTNVVGYVVENPIDDDLTSV